MEKTGFWPWPHRDAGSAQVSFGPEQLAFIRSLTVCWNPAETGAAGLADEAFLDMEGASEDQLTLIEMFLNTASMPDWAGPVRNPFGQAGADPDDMAVCLEDVPDQSVAEILRSGQDFDFAPEDDLLTLWREADLRGEGIDPKRPFGTGHVSRDVRALIDPEKTLSNAAFSKRRKLLESQLMLMLLRFVQAAELPFGDYARDADWHGHPAAEVAARTGEEIDHQEWVSRLYPGQIYQTQDYTKTLQAAGHLMWEGRLKGSYGALADSLELGNFYGVAEHTYSDVPIEDMVRTGLEAFAEGELKPLTRMMVRILNSQSKFKKARKLLKRSGALPDKKVSYRDGISPELVFHAEAVLARLGRKMKKTGLYLDAMERVKLPGLSWSWLDDLQRADAYEMDPAQSHLVEHLQAVAAQLQFMRGPYVPYDD